MNLAVSKAGDQITAYLSAVYQQPANTGSAAVGICNMNMIFRSAELTFDGEFLLFRRNAGIHQQPVVLRADTENPEHRHTVQPLS